MRFGANVRGISREFELTTVNFVTQYHLVREPPGAQFSLLELVNNPYGVPFVPSARSPRGQLNKVTYGGYHEGMNLKPTVAGIRASGAVTHAGSRTEAQALLAAQAVALIFVRVLRMRVSVSDFESKNMVCVCPLNFPVNLRALHARLGPRSAYQPDGEHAFPLLRVPTPFAEPNAPCRASISKRGKILTVGSPNWAHILALLRDIIPAAVDAFPGTSVPRLPWSTAEPGVRTRLTEALMLADAPLDDGERDADAYLRDIEEGVHLIEMRAAPAALENAGVC
jgi:hypothetical protein